jgi:hypothetical protein
MTSSVELFSKFKEYSNILIETGTWTGDGIEKAFASGFKKVYSCDINQEKITLASQRFVDKELSLLCASSEIALEQFLNDINERCVIFLDAHAMPLNERREDKGFGESTLGDGPTCPLLHELEIIKNHPIKNHIILIDDIQCFNTWMFNHLKIEDTIEKVKSINENYNYEFFQNVICFWCDL